MSKSAPQQPIAARADAQTAYRLPTLYLPADSRLPGPDHARPTPWRFTVLLDRLARGADDTCSALARHVVTHEALNRGAKRVGGLALQIGNDLRVERRQLELTVGSGESADALRALRTGTPPEVLEGNLAFDRFFRIRRLAAPTLTQVTGEVAIAVANLMRDLPQTCLHLDEPMAILRAVGAARPQERGQRPA
jgi:hypothetical protein